MSAGDNSTLKIYGVEWEGYERSWAVNIQTCYLFRHLFICVSTHGMCVEVSSLYYMGKCVYPLTPHTGTNIHFLWFPSSRCHAECKLQKGMSNGRKTIPAANTEPRGHHSSLEMTAV